MTIVVSVINDVGTKERFVRESYCIVISSAVKTSHATRRDK